MRDNAMRDDELREIIELMLWRGAIVEDGKGLYKVYISRPLPIPVVFAILHVNVNNKRALLRDLEYGLVDLRPEQEEEIVSVFELALKGKLFEKSEWERWLLSRKYSGQGLEGLRKAI
ncbi:MAG: hypothetical protein QW067_03245 [Thermofilaceae archaeon]